MASILFWTNPYKLEQNARLLVTVLPAIDAEREGWLRLSAERLEQAYGDIEPEYTLSSIREMNPNWK